MANDYFWSLKRDVEAELHSLSLTLSGITENDISEQLYKRLSQQFDRIQDLFDRISEANKDLVLDQTNPELYKLLEGKQAISESYGQFNRQRNIFFKMFAKFRTKEEEFVRERLIPEEPSEEPEEELPEELEEEELLLDEEEYDSDAEKKEKQKARAKRQKKLAADARKVDERNAAQRRLQEEAARLGIFAHPDQPVSEADLYQERIRQDEERIRQENINAERIRSENETLRRHQERMEQAAQFEHLDRHHIDMSKEGIGHGGSGSDPAQDYEQTYQQGQPNVVTGIPLQEETYKSPNEKVSYGSTSKDPQPQPTVQESMDKESGSNFSTPIAPISDEHNSHQPQAQNSHEDGTPQVGFGTAVQPETGSNSGVQTKVSDPQPQPAVQESADKESGSNFSIPVAPISDEHKSQQPQVQNSHKDGTPQLGSGTAVQPDTGSVSGTQQKTLEPNQPGHPGVPGHYPNPNDPVFHRDYRNFVHRAGQKEEQGSASPTPILSPQSKTQTGAITPANQATPSTAGFVPHQFTPGGTVPLAAATAVKWKSTADSNPKIYSALMTNRPEGEEGPVKVSPAFETQMRLNVDLARQAYRDVQGTAAEPDAALEYRRQRDAFAQYRSAVKKGKIQVEAAPGTAPRLSAAGRQTPAAPLAKAAGAATVYAYTPGGTVAQTINQGKLTGNRYEFKNPGLRSKPAYTAANPMVVSPKYEEALTTKMRSATDALNTAIQKGDTKAKAVNPLQVKMYSDAYLGFQEAKRKGTVVVSADGNGPEVPDYHAWQQRRMAQTAKQAPGNTARPIGYNVNKTSKSSAKQTSANVFNFDSHLKHKSLARIYAGQVGTGIKNWSYGAALRLSQKMYRVIQKGDDNAIQTFEQGRYYISTAAGLVLAIQAGAPTKGLENRVAKASNREFNLFGTKSFMSNSELSSAVKKGMRKSSRLEERIGVLEEQLRPFIDKMNKAAAGNPYADKLSFLDEESRATYEKLSAQLRELKDKKAAIDKDLNFHTKLKQLRRESKLEQKILDKLKADGKLPKNPKQLKEAAEKIRQEANEKIEKAFGKYTFEEKGKKIPLHKATDASLSKEIKALKRQSKRLKSEIQALKAKGSLLTQAEKQRLSELLAEVKELKEKLKIFEGLRNARADLDFINNLLDDIIKGAYKNRQRITNGLYALQGFILRPLQVGVESNTEGLARMVQISTNRYVHILVKKSFKASLWVTKVSMNIVVPHSGDMAALAIKNAKASVIETAGTVKSAVKTTVKTGVKQGVAATKQAISSAVPSGIKTGFHSSMELAAEAKGKYDTVAAGIKNVFIKAKNKFAESAIGRGISTVRRFNVNATEAIKAGLKVMKGFGLKALAILGLAYLIIGIISIGGGFLSGVTGSSVIASPDESGDKVDLSKYVAIISRERQAFLDEIDSITQGQEYDSVTLNYIGPKTNTKEMLCMMAVRMSQELDMNKNPEVETYLVSLFDDSHNYTTHVREYDCSGCKEKEEYVLEWNPKTQCMEPVEYVDWETGEVKWKTQMVKYCPGHMDLTVNITILTFDEIYWADTYSSSGQSANAGQKIGDFKITHYCACVECCGKTDGITASGVKATANRTIAVDPDVIPLGSHVIINGKEYVAEDTGGDIQGNRIDIYMDSHQAALNAGVLTNVPVYYPSYEGGSYEETGKWDGWTPDNIEWCQLIYTMPWNEIYTGFTEYTTVVESGELIVEGDFTWPVTTTTQSSGFGMRYHPITGLYKMHYGTDIGVPVGTPVHAAAAGTVIASTNQPGGAGLYISIDHGGGIVTKYFHNSQLLVNVGDTVEAGQVISLSGNTGASTDPHLHFEFWVNGTAIDPRVQYGM